MRAKGRSRGFPAISRWLSPISFKSQPLTDQSQGNELEHIRNTVVKIKHIATTQQATGGISIGHAAGGQMRTIEMQLMFLCCHARRPCLLFRLAPRSRFASLVKKIAYAVDQDQPVKLRQLGQLLERSELRELLVP